MSASDNLDTARMPNLIDRLVCGELDEPGRRELLAWLEAEPARWRICGLVFLEAQEWGLAMKGWVSATAAMPCPTPGFATRDVAAGLRRARVRQLLTTAALAVAFVAGIGARDLAARKAPESIPAMAGKTQSGQTPAPVERPDVGKPAVREPLLAEVEMQVVGGLGQAAPVRIPVVPASLSSGASAGRPTEIPEYVRQQWERRGYDVSVERRYMFAKLPDGQKVAVPVEQVRVNPKPIHIN
jgi:hypothetical protein